MERLNKKIADAGICSRRKADELIQSGNVKVNGVVVTTLGTQVTDKDDVIVNDKLIEKVEKKYLVMNKPRGVICSVSDELKRKTVIDLLPPYYQQYRVFPVGRLDYDTKGVLILTNDGPFMNLLVGPKSGIQKVYLARIDGIILKETIARLEDGIMIEGKVCLPSLIDIESIDRKNNSTLVRITLTEGKYHQVKQMFELVGHKVKHLTRILFGNISVNEVGEGMIRELTIHEIKTLRELSKNDKVLKRIDIKKARRY
jgi:23S rRNA pseudouridine2605 synthase